MTHQNQNISPKLHDTNINGYVSSIIHDQKQMMKEKQQQETSHAPHFYSDIMNDDLTKLDITV